MAAYTFDHRNVTDAETENEPAAVVRVQRDHGALRREGIACIDVGIELPIVSFSLLDSRQAASDIDS